MARNAASAGHNRVIRASQALQVEVYWWALALAPERTWRPPPLAFLSTTPGPSVYLIEALKPGRALVGQTSLPLSMRPRLMVREQAWNPFLRLQALVLIQTRARSTSRKAEETLPVVFPLLVPV